MDSPFSRFFVNYSHGFKGLLNSDFKYEKIQLYYKQPIIIGPLGRTNVTVEMGKPLVQSLGLLSVIPGNQTYFTIENTLATLIFMSLYLTSMRRCNGIIILRAYFLPNSIYAKTELREIIGVRGVYGTISDANRGINASGLQYGS
jgi:hypothetical protein